MCWMMAPLVILGALVVIGVIVVAVILIARLSQGAGQQLQSTETPLAILKRRYAQGEISSEQFEAAKRQLTEPEQRKEG